MEEKLIYLNSYRPICSTKFGINAIKNYNILPFADGSCRREPDFENKYPSITALCRGDKFAPNLKEGNIIVYMTVGGKFNEYKKGHHLVAILIVEKIFTNHEAAKEAYSSMDTDIPSNCMFETKPIEFKRTSGNFKTNKEYKSYNLLSDEQKIKREENRINYWDKEYKKRENKNSCFIKTKSLYLELNNPKVIERKLFEQIFGKIPNTQIPQKIKKEQLIHLLNSLNIDFLYNGLL